MRSYFNNINGILLINKEIGISSFNIISKIKKILNINKIGHTGTLDPLATGLLVALIGKKYTKLSGFISSYNKTYLAKIHLGYNTNTYDREGRIANTSSIQSINQEKIMKSLMQFQGKFKQRPPIFSATNINQTKSHILARKNMIFLLPKKKFLIKKIKFIKLQYPIATLKISCSKGMYVRNIAYKIGQHLNVKSHLLSLKRIKIGSYNIKKSIKSQNLTICNIKNQTKKNTLYNKNLKCLKITKKILLQIKNKKSFTNKNKHIKNNTTLIAIINKTPVAIIKKINNCITPIRIL